MLPFSTACKTSKKLANFILLFYDDQNEMKIVVFLSCRFRFIRVATSKL